VRNDSFKFSVRKPFNEVWIEDKDVRFSGAIEHRHVFHSVRGYDRWRVIARFKAERSNGIFDSPPGMAGRVVLVLREESISEYPDKEGPGALHRGESEGACEHEG